MANVETRRDENTFLGSSGATYEHIFYERRLGLQVYFVEIWARGGSRRGAKGIRTVGQKGWAKSPGRQIWRTGSSRNLSFQGRVGNVAYTQGGVDSVYSKLHHLFKKIRFSSTDYRIWKHGVQVNWT